ncbi:response regulator [Paraburkholderia sp. BR10954]|uniref:response regulator n=1 Tax=Paraburkholderia sp. BR10954 TaxID=3236995 RepID=UPI0034D2D99C
MSTILAVDDDAASREALQAALESAGHEVCAASDGMGTLRAAIGMAPDVIISDVNMPLLDGPDAVRILLALPRFRSVRIVLMSGAEPPAGAPAHVVLRKPINSEQLAQTLEDIARAPPVPSLAATAAARSVPRDGGWDRALAIAALGPPDNRCAQHICRGIELMHDQALRLGRLTGSGLNAEESGKLYVRLVDSVATLVQLLPEELAGNLRPKK